ncbi:IS30 family transposase [Arcanobacterium phocae]|uniref:IS30 family transposase n=1 Tax=Arcanobacterium phocae TaxID=131112 RepID=UPI001C1164F6
MGILYRHLTLEDRVEIEKRIELGQSLAHIARVLGFHRSSINRELKRGSYRASQDQANYRPKPWGRLKTGYYCPLRYLALTAQRKATQRQARSHQPYAMTHDQLIDYVINKLRARSSIEAICGRLPTEHPTNQRMRVCPETLDQWIYHPSQRQRALAQYLPLRHKTRRKRHGRKVHRHSIKHRTSIYSSPPHINQRQEFGHWEIDSIIGKKHASAIHTSVERCSRYLVTRLLADTRAHATTEDEREWINQLPPHAVKSLTADNGHEFAYHYLLTQDTGIITYFANPYSSWQRGTNERFNREIRRYLPKGTDFNTITAQELADITTEINNKPRKCLNWQTPQEVFNQLQ